MQITIDTCATCGKEIEPPVVVVYPDPMCAFCNEECEAAYDGPEDEL